VNIKFNRKGELSVNPYQATIKYNKLDGSPDDDVKWVSKDATAMILFNKNGTPFSGTTSIPVPTSASGATSPKPIKQKKTYEYTIELQPKDGPAFSIDPQVVVEGDSPPPDRGRRGGGR